MYNGAEREVGSESLWRHLRTVSGGQRMAMRARKDWRMVNQIRTRATVSDGGHFDRLWPLLWIVWLPNLAPPLMALFQHHPTPLRAGAVIGGVTLFVVLYLWSAMQNPLSHAAYPAPILQSVNRWPWVPVAALAALSATIILADGPAWLCLLIFTSASVGGRFSLGQSVGVLAGLAVLAGILGEVTHDAPADLGPAIFWAAMAGTLVTILNHLRLTNRALRGAREENARLAVEAERLRFARDMHDLLGHDLARIALQSEVVEALVMVAPEQAIATAHEMGETARTALREVRAAVAGYRQPTLVGELRGAQEILTAAGISYQYEGDRVAVPAALEAVLAWGVREGVTNVVKHSRAQRCTIRATQDQSQVSVEIRDDGRGIGALDDSNLDRAMSRGGSGLPGLYERVTALGGRYAATPCPDGGFRLSIALPLVISAGTGDSPVERAITLADRVTH